MDGKCHCHDLLLFVLHIGTGTMVTKRSKTINMMSFTKYIASGLLWTKFALPSRLKCLLVGMTLPALTSLHSERYLLKLFLTDELITIIKQI
jgi:hypothetical protein